MSLKPDKRFMRTFESVKKRVLDDYPATDLHSLEVGFGSAWYTQQILLNEALSLLSDNKLKDIFVISEFLKRYDSYKTKDNLPDIMEMEIRK